jgi:hypothetical protein
MATIRNRKWTHKGKEKTSLVVQYTDADGTDRIITCYSQEEAEQTNRRVEREVEECDGPGRLDSFRGRIS